MNEIVFFITPNNSLITGIFSGLIGSILGFLANIYITNNNNKTKKEIAIINSNKDKQESENKQLLKIIRDLEKRLDELIEEIKFLEAQLENLEKINEDLTLEGYNKDRVIYQLEEVIKSFKTLFDVIYTQLQNVLKNDPDNMAVLNEVKRKFDTNGS